ncbi:hypothetical protein GS887_25675 [Rhodococcus hoagii]|nr:hypothetical protein [Prescottella equi]
MGDRHRHHSPCTHRDRPRWNEPERCCNQPRRCPRLRDQRRKRRKRHGLGDPNRDAPTISGTPASGTVGRPYSYAFTVAGRPAPTVSVTTGALPDGLTLTSNGLLAGTPTSAGLFEFTLTASNGIDNDVHLPISLGIASATDQNPTPTPAGSLGATGSLGS